ncbi:hypothetical protein [Escherichia coli IS5]|nr:hypothetical protein ECDEC4A_1573 [Escherichia coli DEC4A]CDK51361.1 hypothetical protein [Escherichia coli IS5]
MSSSPNSIQVGEHCNTSARRCKFCPRGAVWSLSHNEIDEPDTPAALLKPF